jgi:hypothetical protein
VSLRGLADRELGLNVEAVDLCLDLWVVVSESGREERDGTYRVPERKSNLTSLRGLDDGVKGSRGDARDKLGASKRLVVGEVAEDLSKTIVRFISRRYNPNSPE